MKHLRAFIVAGTGVLMASLAWASSTPSVPAVQQAYDQAKTEVTDPKQHPADLSIQNVRCEAMTQVSAFVCQVDFVKSSEPQGTLYFDVITLEQRGNKWVLLTGLCRTRKAS
jgi:hypothetical protein